MGPVILEQLLAAGFQVKVLSREGSNHKLPDSVEVAPVNYGSLDSLVAALQGQDALVSTLASQALDKQLLLIEAAAKAGVKRFIPSEFGSDTLHDKTSRLPSFQSKVAVQDALKRKAATPGGLTYTIVVNGPFLDWGVMIGWIVDLKKREINLWDGGERLFSTTTLASVGKAVAGVLRHPAATENRAVYVHDTAMTLRALADKAKAVTGGSEGWKENVKSLDELVNQAWEELDKPQPNPANFVMNFITASIWGEGYGSHFHKTDNRLLGMTEMSDDEVTEVLQRFA